MKDVLTVHLNRDGPHSISVDAGTLETSGPFDIKLENHGAALHVHLHLDDDLSTAASLESTNHYVEANDTQTIGVEVRPQAFPANGRLKIVTGYGSETAYVSIVLDEATDEPRRVRVDESLGQPRPRPEPSEPRYRGLPALVFGAIAVLIALAAAIVIGGPAGIVGFVVVLVGVGLAIALLRT